LFSNFISNIAAMKQSLLASFLIFCFLILISYSAPGQCAICTKTAQQLGEGPAKGLNGAILYLAIMPFILFGFIGYRWWKNNRDA